VSAKYRNSHISVQFVEYTIKKHLSKENLFIEILVFSVTHFQFFKDVLAEVLGANFN